MKSRGSFCLLLLGIFVANILSQSTQALPPINAIPSSIDATPSYEFRSMSTLPTTSSTASATRFDWEEPFSAADYLLDEVNRHLHVDLRKRQGGIPATAAPAATTVATQMSPITTYGPKQGWPATVYTQVFAAVPDQWPSAQAGTIGLGTIQGQVGVVKTKSKRSVPTASAGQVLKIKGREVTLS